MLHLKSPHTYRIEMTVDEVEWQRDVIGLVIANGRFVGGGFPIAPGAILDDGWMDLTLIPEMPGLELMTAGLNISLGREPDNVPVETTRARKVLFRATPEMPFSVDGEPIERFDATFEVLPGALQVVASPTAPALAISDPHNTAAST